MLRVDVIFNPEVDNIDFEETERKMNLITSKFMFADCRKHPDTVSQVSFKVEDGQDYAAPVKFCCFQYEEQAMFALRLFLNTQVPKS